MKRNLKRYFGLAIILCCSLYSCKKDSIYRDYENHVKEFDGNTLEFLQSQQGKFDSLLLVLDRLPNLKDSIANRELTVFAVTNTSFKIAINNLNDQRLSKKKKLLSLKDLDLLQLDTLMSRYLINGLRTSDAYKDVADGVSLQSLNYGYTMHVDYKKLNASGLLGGGPQTLVFADTKNTIFIKFWEKTTTDVVNIKTSNSIVNILSSGHEFGFNEFTSRFDN